MEKQRVLELALKGLREELENLETERKRITGEIASVRKQLKGASTRKTTKKKRKLSAAERKRRSERMKQFWAERRKKKKSAKSKK